MSSPTKRDPYEVLGVDRGADQDAIKRAFKKLAKKYHPDVSKDPLAHDRMSRINEAFELMHRGESIRTVIRY